MITQLVLYLHNRMSAPLCHMRDPGKLWLNKSLLYKRKAVHTTTMTITTQRNYIVGITLRSFLSRLTVKTLTANQNQS